VEEITDTALFNAAPSYSAASILYTAPAGDLIQGVSIAPTPEPSTWIAMAGGIGILMGFSKFRRGARRA
jgi:hypothetical protein